MRDPDPNARRDVDRRVRELIYAHFVAHGHAPAAGHVASSAGIGLADVTQALKRIERPDDVVLVPGSQSIWMAHPFCAPHTGYRVSCNGQEFWVACAWDALGVAGVLDADVELTAPCPDCGKTLRLETRNGRVEGDGVIHFVVPPASSFDDIGFTCATTLLFESVDHARRWCEQRHLPHGDVMSLQQGYDLFRILSRGAARLQGEWTPSGLNERLAAFREVGLTSEFWMTLPVDAIESKAPPPGEDARPFLGNLTQRELIVLELLVDAKSQKQIAHLLELSPHTVDTHVRNIYAKLKVRSRAAAVAIALRERAP
jgi:DNA-binding CsgD family transcriptional regulator